MLTEERVVIIAETLDLCVLFDVRCFSLEIQVELFVLIKAYLILIYKLVLVV